MLDNYKPLKIGKNWDLSEDEITKNTLDEIKLIILYKNKFLSKVSIGEWTEDEYKNFSIGIKKMSIQSFVYFSDIFEFFLELSKEEILEEIDNLIQKGFIKTDAEINISLLSDLINEICSRMLSISYMCFNEDEKNLNLPHEQQIEICNSILEQLNNPDFDYIELMTSTFSDWVNQNFSNQKLKAFILNKTDFIISNKRKFMKRRLNNSLKIIKKKSNIHDQYQYFNVTSYKNKSIIKKKNRT